MPSEIVTTGELQDYMGKSTDKQMSAVRNSINTFVESYCHREFAADIVDRTEWQRIESPYQRVYLVKKPPIVSFTKLETGHTAPLGLVDATSYEIEEGAGIVRMISSFLLNDTRYTATYKGGYAVIPADLKLAAMSIMAREIELVAKGRAGMHGRSFQGGSVELLITELTKTEKLALDSYTLRRFD